MRFDILAAAAAIFLFAAYFIPIMIKLMDLPLTIVVFGGIVLVAVDLWQSLGDRSG